MRFSGNLSQDYFQELRIGEFKVQMRKGNRETVKSVKWEITNMVITEFGN